MKRCMLTITLVLSLLIGMIPISVTAAETSGTCGDNISWELGATGILTISGEGELQSEYTVTSKSGWYSLRAQIKKVVIEEGITSIGNEAFYDCYNLTDIKLPQSLETIGDSAFNGCTSDLTVKYCGTEKQWEYISIGYNNEELNNASFIYGYVEPIIIDLYGDINDDGIINAVESALIKMILVGNYKSADVRTTDRVMLAADVNKDGVVNSADSYTLKMIIVGVVVNAYDISELFTEYDEKSLYEMEEFIAENQEVYEFLEFVRDPFYKDRANMIYIHMASELTPGAGKVPDLGAVGITDRTGKYLVSTARVTKPDADIVNGWILLGDIGNKVMTIELNAEFIEHINSLDHLEGNNMILDFLMNLLDSEEVVGISWSLN